MCDVLTKSYFDDDYETERLIGDGGYGSVFLAISRKNRSKRYAVKMLKKNGSLRPLQEAKILHELSPHPNIIHFEACYDEKDTFYIVTEYLPYGDLFTLVTEGEQVTSPTVITGPPQPLTEKECRRIVKEILLAVKHLHDRGIVHRDLKLENILLSAPLNDLQAENIIKIIDFGFAMHAYGASLIESVGSYYYAAPEIYKKEPYGKCVDLWAIGVITFALLSGHFPFHSVDIELLKRKIMRGKFEFINMIDEDTVGDESSQRKQINIWDKISNEAKNFITSFLQVNPKHRMLIDQALEHSWIQKDVFDIITVVRVHRVCKKWRRRISQRLSKNLLTEGETSNDSSDFSPFEASFDPSLITKSPPIESSALTTVRSFNDNLQMSHDQKASQDQREYEVSRALVTTDINENSGLTFHPRRSETEQSPSSQYDDRDEKFNETRPCSSEEDLHQDQESPSYCELSTQTDEYCTNFFPSTVNNHGSLSVKTKIANFFSSIFKLPQTMFK